jgi:hypothetical protein
VVLKFGFSGFVGGGKMQEVQITDKEYDKLIKRIEFFDAMRNNLLTHTSHTKNRHIIGSYATLGI